ncbi:hypothetical protein [Roseateles asaccharophilus]|uniref:Uncharacterized protein n=1 Tax=Roseateles asaccharophilus TaxID=582607 RepID=A0ABU2A887_9BURK|nr:hypothetical protein [Roseateles asaccharophilus]MDR7333376.1 hypothetical protein [Roseateles asaccharophilus]
MSRIKTVTSALTAAFLVSGIGFAVAQSEDQPQTEPMSTTALPSEQTPADPNAAPVDTTAQQDQQLQQQQPPVDQPMPAQPADTTTTTATDPSIPAATTTSDTSYTEPAPRADRN